MTFPSRGERERLGVRALDHTRVGFGLVEGLDSLLQAPAEWLSAQFGDPQLEMRDFRLWAGDHRFQRRKVIGPGIGIGHSFQYRHLEPVYDLLSSYCFKGFP